MTCKFNPRNRNVQTQDAPKSTARWFDKRCDKPKAVGFEPERWSDK